MNDALNEYFEVKECEFSFETVFKNENISQKRVNELKTSKVLFLPVRNYHHKEDYLFYSAARDFYSYCKKENPNNSFDFCTEKDNYHELALNSYELFLGSIIIQYAVLPFFINLISSYVFEKLKKDDKINFNIIITNDEVKKNYEIFFRGTRDDFKEKVLNTLQTYSREGKLTVSEQKGTIIDVLS